MRTFLSRQHKFSALALCLILALSAFPRCALAAEQPTALYQGFAGQYQHIYADGQKLRDDGGAIVADNSEINDMSDQFLPRDMGDGGYAFESRSSNQPHIEKQLVEVYDEYYDEWTYEYKDVEVWNGYTRRIAAAEQGASLPASNYVFGKSEDFDGMNDDTQHWIRVKSENYTDSAPSYYLKSMRNGLYLGLSSDGRIIAADYDHKAAITFEALSDQSPLYLLSQTDAYAALTVEQRARIERVYESVAGDAFERNGAVMAENASPRGRLDAIYKNSKNQYSYQLLQALNGYISIGGGYATMHRSSTYHVSLDLPGSDGVSASRGTASIYYGHPNWYHWAKNSSRKFSVYDLTINGPDGEFQQTITMWVQDGDASCAANAERFEEIVTDIPFVYRKGITNLLIENDSVNSYFSAGQYLYIRLNHPNSAQSILDYLIHEMGHSLDAKKGGGNNWSVNAGEWEQARQADMFSMSSYGANVNETYNAEDFAEFCRFYFSCFGNRDRQRAIQILCPNRYKLLKEIRDEYLEGLSLWEDGITLPLDTLPDPTPTTEPTATPTVTLTPAPTAEPTPTPTVEPTATPTATPTVEPTVTPTVEPTATPTTEPTAIPTVEPTATPTAEPTAAPATKPTATPTAEPTATPTAEPTAAPTAEPTAAPTTEPTATPTAEPTATPTAEPTATPTTEPTTTPTSEPTPTPTVEPTAVPTATPTAEPTAAPTSAPTAIPTATPTTTPTVNNKFIINKLELTDGALIADITAADGKSAVLIAAAYTEDGFLADIAFADIDADGTFALDLNTDGAAQISAFIWDSLSSARPLCDKYILNLP